MVMTGFGRGVFGYNFNTRYVLYFCRAFHVDFFFSCGGVLLGALKKRIAPYPAAYVQCVNKQVPNTRQKT